MSKNGPAKFKKLSKDFIKGTCMEMCPKFEIELREREKLLHPFEIVRGTENDARPKGDRNRMVKSFTRSAAGKYMEVPENIRPPDVLLKTVNYLLTDIVRTEGASWITIYDFVMDRLRAVRQDLVIQNASAAHYVTILQPIIRFYAYSAYRLCEEHYNIFDQHINNVHFQECLKRLMCAYDELNCLCDVKNDGKDFYVDFLVENRPYFESLYILLNLGNGDAITRGLGLSKIWKTDLVMVSLNLSLAYSRNNFYRICRKFETLPILHAAILCLQLPHIRRKALKIMSVAYNSKNLTYPEDVLQNILLYDSVGKVRKDCEYYGLKVNQLGISFTKMDFNDTKDVGSPERSDLIEQQLEGIDVSDLILFNRPVKTF